MAEATREALGDERIAWLQGLPQSQSQGPVALVHASPGNPWAAPLPAADDSEMEAVFCPLGRPVAVYAHIHRPFVRILPRLTVANTGS